MERTHAIGAPRGVSPRRRPSGFVLGLAVFVALGGIAGVSFATEGESYPSQDDAGIERAVAAWRERLGSIETTLCTGTVRVGRTASWRDPAGSTPTTGPWNGFDTYADANTVGPAFERTVGADGSEELSDRRGGDTDASGCDAFLFYRFVGRGGSLFAKVILEAEDDEARGWKLCYRGTETARITNDATTSGGLLVVRNDWSIEWNRRVVDFDAMAGEYDEAKSVRQDFSLRLQLIDGREVAAGERLTLTTPSGVRRSTAVGVHATATAGDDSGIDVGLGLTWGSEQTCGTFRELGLGEREHTEVGSAVVRSSLPCPSAVGYPCATYFTGDFAIDDDEGFSGSKGARQELQLVVTNFIASVLVAECSPCRPHVPPPPPTTPPTGTLPGPVPPTPTVTPPEPLHPTTPSGAEPPTGGPHAPPPGPAPAPRDADPDLRFPSPSMPPTGFPAEPACGRDTDADGDGSSVRST